MNMIRSDWYTSLQAIRLMPSRFHPWKIYGKCLSIVETLVYKEFPRCMQLQQLPKDTLFAMRFLINDDEVEEEEEEQDLHLLGHSGRWFESDSDDGRIDSDDAVDGSTTTTTATPTPTTPTPTAADIIGDDDGELIVGAQLIKNDEKANTPKNEEQIMKTRREKKKKTRRRMNLGAADQCPSHMKSTEITVGALVESVLWCGSDDSDDEAVVLEHDASDSFLLSAIATTADNGESLSIFHSDDNNSRVTAYNNNCDDATVNQTRRQVMRNERLMDPYQSHALRIAFSID
jgi:hypothetical protein